MRIAAVLTAHAAIMGSIGVLFVGGASLFHWLGPVCGSYDFKLAVDVFFGELAHGGWASLLLLSAALFLTSSRPIQTTVRGSFGYGALACVLSGFLYWKWGQHQPWWSVVSMLLMVYLSLMQVGLPRFFGYGLVSLVGYLAIGYSFTLLKAAVFLRGAVFDPVLVEMDLRLFGFHLYKSVSLWVQQSEFWMVVVDRIYVQLFVFMLFNVVACAYVGGQRLVRRYAMALMICYALGVLGYLMVPAYGPFVHDPETYSQGWSNGPWQVADIQRFILQRTLDVARCTQPQIAPFAFVAAMPSLHVAVPALGAVLLWGVWRPWGLMLVPLFLTAFASVATGMHYGVDLLAGVALAIISGWLAWKLQPRED